MNNFDVTPTEIAWLAGIIDGEGTIGFYRINPKNGSGRRSASCMVSLRISNSDPRIVQECQRVMVCLTKRTSIPISTHAHPQRRLEYKISLNKQADIASLLQSVLQYLVGKKDQAMLLIKILTERTVGSRWSENHMSMIPILSEMKRFS